LYRNNAEKIPIKGILVKPDGKRFALLWRTGGIAVFDASNGAAEEEKQGDLTILRLPGVANVVADVEAVAYSDDGIWAIVSGSTQSTVRRAVGPRMRVIDSPELDEMDKSALKAWVCGSTAWTVLLSDGDKLHVFSLDQGIVGSIWTFGAPGLIKVSRDCKFVAWQSTTTQAVEIHEVKSGSLISVVRSDSPSLIEFLGDSDRLVRADSGSLREETWGPVALAARICSLLADPRYATASRKEIAEYCSVSNSR
jgi:hypothetical protein